MEYLTALETIRQTFGYDQEQALGLLSQLIERLRAEERDFGAYLDREEAAAAAAMEGRAA